MRVSNNVQADLVMNVFGKTAEGQKQEKNHKKKICETRAMPAQWNELLSLVSDCKEGLVLNLCRHS